MKLTDMDVRQAKPAEREYSMSDGHGLTLLVQPWGAKTWHYRYYFNGRRTKVSFGNYPEVTLAVARELHQAARKDVAAGKSPADTRRAEAVTMSVLFGDYSRKFLADYAEKNALSEKTRYNTKLGLDCYIEALGDSTPLGAIDAPKLHRAVRAVEQKNGHDNAKKGLQVVRNMFAEATAAGVLPFDPSATIKLERAKVKNSRKGVTDAEQLGQLVRDVRAYTGEKVVKLGVQLLALCFTRPGELRLAQWDEFELDADVPMWKVPAARTKMRKEHLVPLSRQAVAILRELHKLTGHTPTVLTLNGGKPLANNAFNEAMHDMGYKDEQHPHGFRVTAATMLSELGQDDTVIELALAHAVPGVKGIYNRAYKLPQRRELLQFWADYLDKLAG